MTYHRRYREMHTDGDMRGTVTSSLFHANVDASRVLSNQGTKKRLSSEHHVYAGNCVHSISAFLHT